VSIGEGSLYGRGKTERRKDGKKVIASLPFSRLAVLPHHQLSIVEVSDLSERGKFMHLLCRKTKSSVVFCTLIVKEPLMIYLDFGRLSGTIDCP
jgi:hypothetical protein